MKLLIAAVLTAALVAPSTEASAKIAPLSWSKNWITVFGDPYRRQGALGVTVGSFGYVPSSVVAKWQQQGVLTGTLEVTNASQINVPVDEMRKQFNVGASANIPVSNVTLPADFVAGNANEISQHYNLLMVSLKDPLAVVKTEYAKSAHQSLVKDRDYRVIVSTLSVFGYVAKSQFTAKSEGSVHVPGASSDAINLNLGYGAQGSQTITINDATVIGYRFAGICWANGEIHSLFYDGAHMGNARPKGCYRHDQKLPKSKT